MSEPLVMYTLMDSPIGGLLLTSDGAALTGVWMEPHEPIDERWQRTDRGLRPAVEQLSAYFEGDLREFDLTLALRGTEFQRRVWNAVRSIPYGTTVSYAEVARRIGAPQSARAAGAAIGRNPVTIVVPCHRVIGSSGGLTGYGGGLDRKRWLLELEGKTAFDAPLTLAPDRAGRRSPPLAGSRVGR